MKWNENDVGSTVFPASDAKKILRTRKVNEKSQRFDFNNLYTLIMIDSQEIHFMQFAEDGTTSNSAGEPTLH